MSLVRTQSFQLLVRLGLSKTQLFQLLVLWGPESTQSFQLLIPSPGTREDSAISASCISCILGTTKDPVTSLQLIVPFGLSLPK